MELQTKGPEKLPVPKQWGRHVGPVMGRVLFPGHGHFPRASVGDGWTQGLGRRELVLAFPASHETPDESLNLSVSYFLLLTRDKTAPGYLLPKVTARTK